MNYHTIKEIEEVSLKKIIGISYENKWIILTLESGLRIKIENWK